MREKDKQIAHWRVTLSLMNGASVARTIVLLATEFLMIQSTHLSEFLYFERNSLGKTIRDFMAREISSGLKPSYYGAMTHKHFSHMVRQHLHRHWLPRGSLDMSQG